MPLKISRQSGHNRTHYNGGHTYPSVANEQQFSLLTSFNEMASLKQLNLCLVSTISNTMNACAKRNAK
jgi:hypothetical protein